MQALWSDISSQDDDAFSVRTCQSYLYALREIFVTEDMPAWNPNLRSKTAIRTSDTRYFTDPSVAAAALQIGPQDLLFGATFFTTETKTISNATRFSIGKTAVTV